MKLRLESHDKLEVCASMGVKNTVFLDVIPCSLVGSYGFRTNVLPPVLG